MKKTILVKAILVVFLVLAIYLISSVGIGNIINKISQSNPFYIFGAFLSILLMHIVNATRWYVFIKPKIIKPLKLFWVYLAGVFFTTVTPTASVGGEPLRAYYVSKIEKTSFVRGTSIAFIEKFVYGDILLGIPLFYSFLISLARINAPSEIKSALISLVGLVILVAIALISVKHNFIRIRKLIERILVWFYRLEFLQKKYDTFQKFKKKVHVSVIEFFEIIKESFKDKRLFWKGISLGLLSWFLYFFSFYLIFIALGTPIDVSNLIIAVSIARLISFITFIPGGIGITESTLFGMFAALSINPVVGASAILIQRGISYFYSLAAGYAAFSYLGIKDTKK